MAAIKVTSEQLQSVSSQLASGARATTARDLANKLGVEVLAPDNKVWAFPNGRLTIGPTQYANTDKWVPFRQEPDHETAASRVVPGTGAW